MFLLGLLVSTTAQATLCLWVVQITSGLIHQELSLSALTAQFPTLPSPTVLMELLPFHVNLDTSSVDPAAWPVKESTQIGRLVVMQPTQLHALVDITWTPVLVLIAPAYQLDKSSLAIVQPSTSPASTLIFPSTIYVHSAQPIMQPGQHAQIKPTLWAATLDTILIVPIFALLALLFTPIALSAPQHLLAQLVPHISMFPVILVPAVQLTVALASPRRIAIPAQQALSWSMRSALAALLLTWPGLSALLPQSLPMSAQLDPTMPLEHVGLVLWLTLIALPAQTAQHLPVIPAVADTTWTVMLAVLVLQTAQFVLILRLVVPA